MISWIPTKKIDWHYVQELLTDSELSGKMTNGGPVVQRLEKFISKTLRIRDSKEVICVSNGTVALWATIAAIELEQGKKLKWATQAFTFPSSAQGYLNPQIIDIDLEGGLDLNKVPNDIDGIIVTNVFGNTVNIAKYEKWAKDFGKYLVFDNAASPLSVYNTNTNINNAGTASTISFHHTKPFGFGEGGAIIIDNKYSQFVRRIINFGIDNANINSSWSQFGGNYKMSDIAAAFILQYIDKEQFEKTIDQNKKLYKYALSKLPDTIKAFPSYDSSPFVSCLALLMDPFKSIYAQSLLMENNIFCRKYYKPLQNLPVAMEFYNQIICVPLHSDMKESDIDLIFGLLKNSGDKNN